MNPSESPPISAEPPFTERPPTKSGLSRTEWIICGMGCAWGAAVLCHVYPFLAWRESPVLAAALCWLAFLPVAGLLVAGYRFLLGLVPESATESKNVAYIPRLDHLRFFAAALVVTYHYYHKIVPFEDEHDDLILNLFNEGQQGVDLFFVLSGLIFGLIGWGKKFRYGSFLASRIVRIYPLYLLGIVIVVAGHIGWYTPTDIALLLFPVLDGGILPGLPGFGQLWTIGLEFQFYLILPFLVLFIARNRAGFLAGLVVLCLLLRSFYYWVNGTVLDMSYWTMLGRFDEFAAGMLAAGLYLKNRQRFSSPVHLALAIAAMLACFKWTVHWGGYYHGGPSPVWIVWTTIQGVMWAYLVLSYVSCAISFPAWWDVVAGQLGRLSFSIYVFHLLAIDWTMRLFIPMAITGSRRIDAALVALLVCLPAATLIALLSYHFIEKQFFVFRRKYVVPLPSETPVDAV